MSQELFNGMILIFTTAGLGAVGWLLRVLFDNQSKTTEDVKAIKTFLIITNKAFAMTLHSPHTQYYDSLLVKLVESHGKLTEREWDDLEKISSEIEHDLRNEREKRAIAANTIALCCLLRGKPLPPPKAHIEETET